MSIDETKHIKEVISSVTKDSAIGPEIIHGLVMQESKYNPHVVSATGNKALCQITRDTIKDLFKKHEFDFTFKESFKPENQVVLATTYLNDLITDIGTRYPKISYQKALEISLYSYNAGPGTVNTAIKMGGLKNYKRFLPNKKYAKDVFNNSRTWDNVEVTPTPNPRYNKDLQYLSIFFILIIFMLLSVNRYLRTDF